MSVVACRVYEDRIEIAADSIVVRDCTQAKGERIKFAKLAQVNGMTIGTVGKCEESTLFLQFCETRKPASNTERDVRAFLVEFAEWKKKQTEAWAVENRYIFIVEKRAFHIDEFMVCGIVNYEAIGAGQDFALAALYLGRDVRESVEAACELSIYCEKPIIHFVIPL